MVKTLQYVWQKILKLEEQIFISQSVAKNKTFWICTPNWFHSFLWRVCQPPSPPKKK